MRSATLLTFAVVVSVVLALDIATFNAESFPVLTRRVVDWHRKRDFVKELELIKDYDIIVFNGASCATSRILKNEMKKYGFKYASKSTLTMRKTTGGVFLISKTKLHNVHVKIFDEHCEIDRSTANGFVYAETKTEGGKVGIIASHLLAVDSVCSREVSSGTRRHQLAEISRFVQALAPKHKIIFAGSFNIPPYDLKLRFPNLPLAKLTSLSEKQISDEFAKQSLPFSMVEYRDILSRDRSPALSEGNTPIVSKDEPHTFSNEAVYERFAVQLKSLSQEQLSYMMMKHLDVLSGEQLHELCLAKLFPQVSEQDFAAFQLKLFNQMSDQEVHDVILDIFLNLTHDSLYKVAKDSLYFLSKQQIDKLKNSADTEEYEKKLEKYELVESEEFKIMLVMLNVEHITFQYGNDPRQEPLMFDDRLHESSRFPHELNCHRVLSFDVWHRPVTNNCYPKDLPHRLDYIMEYKPQGGIGAVIKNVIRLNTKPDCSYDLHEHLNVSHGVQARIAWSIKNKPQSKL